jgi:hypothetical protein
MSGACRPTVIAVGGAALRVCAVDAPPGFPISSFIEFR